MRPSRLTTLLALSLLGAGCVSTATTTATSATAPQGWSWLNLEEVPCAIRRSSDGSMISGVPEEPGFFTLVYGVNSIASRGNDGDEMQGSMKLTTTRSSAWSEWNPMTIQLADSEEAGIPMRGYVVVASFRGLDRFRYTGFDGELRDGNGRLMATLSVDSGSLSRVLNCHGS